MSCTQNNVEFSYMYRDAGNYKRFNSIVFANPKNINDLVALEQEIRMQLFDEEFFYPYLLHIPLIHFDDWDSELDHDWYEFRFITFSENLPNDKQSRTIEEFITDLKKYAKEPDVITLSLAQIRSLR